MKKFRLLVIAMTLGVSGWVHADTPPIQVESKSVEREIVVDSQTWAGFAAKAGDFSFRAGQSLAQDFNFKKVGVPYYLESGRASHVPEPEGWAMMLMGAGFVVYQVRRRKRARKAWDVR